MTEKYRIPFIPNSPRQIGEISQSMAQELSKDEEGTEKVEVFNTFKEYVYKITGNMAQLQ